MGSHSINDLVQAFAPNNGERLTNSINIRKIREAERKMQKIAVESGKKY
jgi:hypothetical protein